MLAQVHPGSGAAQAANPGQVGLFVRDLPSRPYCCDDLGFGLQIRRRDVALSRRYIQHNKPTTVRWLAFDCDYKNALELALERNLPPPNLAILNRKNGHSHLLYSLELGVHRTHSARRKPLWYLAKIEHSLRAELRADPNYVGLVVKNPLHQAWLSYEVRPTSYNLDELADHLTLPARLPVERRSGLSTRLRRLYRQKNSPASNRRSLPWLPPGFWISAIGLLSPTNPHSIRAKLKIRPTSASSSRIVLSARPALLRESR